MSRRLVVRAVVAGLLALAAAAWAGAAGAGVTVSLSPAAQTVAPGAEFDVLVDVTAGSPFNAFDLLVGYDPGLLTPVPLAPLSGQIGPLPKNACAMPFHRFHGSAGADTANYSMLCAGVSVSGPGTIYKLRFRAAATVATTTLRFLPGTQFFDAGVLVAGPVTHDAAVGIGTAPTLDAGGPPPGVALAAAPNPARGGTRFEFGAPLPARATLRVLDVQGRAVRVLEAPAGARALAWDGRDAAGLAAAPGRYLVVLAGPGRAVRGSVTIVR